MTTVAFVSTKMGVGKTTLVYHLAHMFAERGVPVLAADFDPQANLSTMFLDESRIVELWDSPDKTVFGVIDSSLNGRGDVVSPHVEPIARDFGILVGDLQLSHVEDALSVNWILSNTGDPEGLRVTASFWRVIEAAAEKSAAKLILIDVGANTGPINRAALIATQHVVIPTTPDLLSNRGNTTLGSALTTWRDGWAKRLARAEYLRASLPDGAMRPVGYVIQQFGVRVDVPGRSPRYWIDRLPISFRTGILGEKYTSPPLFAEEDPYCLMRLKYYRSLMPLAIEARKPMFHLTPADGAIGAHGAAVRDCYNDFLVLARRIAAAVGVDMK